MKKKKSSFVAFFFDPAFVSEFLKTCDCINILTPPPFLQARHLSSQIFGAFFFISTFSPEDSFYPDRSSLLFRFFFFLSAIFSPHASLLLDVRASSSPLPLFLLPLWLIACFISRTSSCLFLCDPSTQLYIPHSPVQACPVSCLVPFWTSS